MSLLSALNQKVIELTTVVNSIIAKTKKTDDFNHQDNLNADSKIRVFIDGVSEYITVRQIVDSALLSNYNVGVNGIVSGTIEYIGGLSHRTKNLVYRFNNVLYYSNGFTLTSNSNTSGLSRIDVFYGDTDLDGSLFILEGEPGGTKPVLEWGHQIELTFVTIANGATEPSGVSNILWYNENLQEVGGEKNTSTANPTNVILASTEQASIGTKSVKIVSKNAFNLNSTTKYLGSNLSNVLLDVFCKDAGKNNLILQLFDTVALKVGEVNVTHGSFNFDANLINQWQTIIIPGTAFRVGGLWNNEEYDLMIVSNNKNGSTIHVDNIRIQQGTPAVSVPVFHTHSNLSILQSITQEMLDSIGDKANASDLSPVAFSGAYTDLTGKPNIVAIEHRYLNITELIAEQGTQSDMAIQYVNDASADPTVTSGYAYYEYLGTILGTLADYRKLSEQESMDLAPITASEVKALYESNANTNPFTDALKTKLDSITAIFTTELKTAYDDAVTWISTNATNLLNHLTRTDNPHAVTKAQVGLDQVDNTSDLAKPVSTLQATADANTLNSANTYADSLITQLIDNAPTDANFIHTQTIPSDTWSINHQLNKYPSVTIIDTIGNEIEGSVLHLDNNNLTITFSVVLIGTAVLN
ncbi:MAG: hypothetical protein KGZ87_08895 [Bacteroidetes bacterium]|nr:hypothetical protein [Bacteroidota bacterium]